jgi:hypothetical protein
MGEVHPATLENVTLLQNTTYATATFRPLPLITVEGLTIDLLQRGNNAPLQTDQKFFDL